MIFMVQKVCINVSTKHRLIHFYLTASNERVLVLASFFKSRGYHLNDVSALYEPSECTLYTLAIVTLIFKHIYFYFFDYIFPFNCVFN